MKSRRLAGSTDESPARSSRHVTRPCPTILPLTLVKNASQLSPGVKPLHVVRAEVVEKRLAIGAGDRRRSTNRRARRTPQPDAERLILLERNDCSRLSDSSVSPSTRDHRVLRIVDHDKALVPAGQAARVRRRFRPARGPSPRPSRRPAGSENTPGRAAAPARVARRANCRRRGRAKSFGSTSSKSALPMSRPSEWPGGSFEIRANRHRPALVDQLLGRRQRTADVCPGSATAAPPVIVAITRLTLLRTVRATTARDRVLRLRRATACGSPATTWATRLAAARHDLHRHRHADQPAGFVGLASLVPLCVGDRSSSRASDSRPIVSALENRGNKLSNAPLPRPAGHSRSAARRRRRRSCDSRAAARRASSCRPGTDSFRRPDRGRRTCGPVRIRAKFGAAEFARFARRS